MSTPAKRAKRAKFLEEKKQSKIYLCNETPLQILKGSGADLTDVALSPCGSIVAAVSENADMHLWHRETGE